MPTFRVKDTFEIQGKSLFVLAGTILDGTIRTGMSISVPLNSGMSVTALVHAIEFTDRRPEDNVCLCIRYSNHEELELWQALDVAGETLQITNT